MSCRALAEPDIDGCAGLRACFAPNWPLLRENAVTTSSAKCLAEDKNSQNPTIFLLRMK